MVPFHFLVRLTLVRPPISVCLHGDDGPKTWSQFRSSMQYLHMVQEVPEMRSPTLPSGYLAWVAADGSGTSEASKIEWYWLLYAPCEQMMASLEPASIVVYSSQTGNDLRLLDGLRVLALACVPRDALLATYRSWCRVAIPKTLPKTFQRGCLDPEPNAGRRFTAALPWHVSSSRHCILVAAC